MKKNLYDVMSDFRSQLEAIRQKAINDGLTLMSEDVILYDGLDFNSYMNGQKDAIDRIESAFQYPSCFTCKHGFISGDSSVGIPEGLEECKRFPDLYPPDDDNELDEEFYASECGGWEPDFKGLCYL